MWWLWQGNSCNRLSSGPIQKTKTKLETKLSDKISQIIAKKNQQKLVCLTAYTFPIAKILDDHCDVILVGDSLGMAIYGMADTVEVSLEMMINHGKAVRRVVSKALLVVDLPFGTYESSPSLALETARRVLKETACDAIKIETDEKLLPIVEFLCQNQIPVMAHVGLLPQHVREIGGYRYQGKDAESAAEILKIAKLLEKAGAFAIVIEAVPALLASEITKALSIPTIGIGASPNCDGQILVIDDLLGLNQEFKPRFVRAYANLAQSIDEAVKNFANQVKNHEFPAPEHLV